MVGKYSRSLLPIMELFCFYRSRKLSTYCKSMAGHSVWKSLIQAGMFQDVFIGAGCLKAVWPWRRRTSDIIHSIERCTGSWHSNSLTKNRRSKHRFQTPLTFQTKLWAGHSFPHVADTQGRSKPDHKDHFFLKPKRLCHEIFMLEKLDSNSVWEQKQNLL